MGKGSAPSAPNPWQAAQAQYEFGTSGANYSTALNDMNQVNPFFSTTYGENPNGMQQTAPYGSVSNWDPANNPTQVPPGFVSPAGGASTGGGGGAPPAWNTGGGGGATPGWKPIAHQFAGPASPGGGPGAGPPGAGQYPQAPPTTPGGQPQTGYGLPNGGYGPASYATSPQSASGVPNLTPPQYSVTQALTAPEQYAAEAAQGQAANAIGQGAPTMPGMQYQPGQYQGLEYGLNQGAEQQVLAGGMAAISPQMKVQSEQMDASLRNSGITPESNPTAYWNAMGPMMQNQGGQIAQLEGQAAQTGIGEQTASNQAAGQSYQEALQNAQLSNTARGQALDQYAQQTGIPLSEMGQLEGIFSGGGGGGGGGASVSTPDIMQAMQNQYQGQLNQYNANVGSSNAAMGDATSLIAAYMMM